MSVKVIVDHSASLALLLRKRAIDFFVGEISQLSKRDAYEIVSLPQQQGYFCCRRDHPLTTRPSLDLNDIRAYPMALMWMPERIFTLLSRLLGADIRKNEDLGAGLIECDNLNILLGAVSGSDAVTIASREIVSGSIHKEAVCLLPLLIPELRSAYAIVGLKGFTTIPAIVRLKELFLEISASKVLER